MVRESASGAVGCVFVSRHAISKALKMGTGSSLAEARNTGVVPGKYKKAVKYLLTILVMSQ